MTPNLTAFQEPRGVMRILQFIFSICAFATTTGFTNFIRINICENPTDMLLINYAYPFQLDRLEIVHIGCNTNANVTDEVRFDLFGDFSSDSRFFVATGVLSMLYTIGIAVVYAMYHQMYSDNPLLPIADFGATAILAVFWLSSSAAWSNGLAGLKSITSDSSIRGFPSCQKLKCTAAYTGSFSTLNISLILGFLNFFLWASDLWFVYKETEWFKNSAANTNANPEV